MQFFSPTRGAVLLLLVLAVPVAAGSAGASRDLLPNLVELPPSDIAVAPAGAGYELEFTSTAGNSGAGPLVVVATRARASAAFAAVQEIALAGGGVRTRPVAVTLRFQSAPGHDHFHLARFERYELRDATGKVILRDSKAGYCLGDRARLGTAAGAARFLASCGAGKPGLLRLREGISSGWADPYAAGIAGQSFPLAGLPAGTYTLVNRVNDERVYLEAGYADDVAAAKLALAWPDGPAGAPVVTVIATCLAERC